MEQKKEESMNEKLEILSVNITQSINRLSNLSSELRNYLDRIEKFKDEVEELITCIDAQSEQIDEMLKDIEYKLEEKCFECGDSIEDQDGYEVKTPKGKRILLCSSCYYER